MRNFTQTNGGGVNMFPSAPQNQSQPSWRPRGQGQHVAMQHQHPLLSQQQQHQQQQHQQRLQHNQNQPLWGTVIPRGSAPLLVGQQQQIQQQPQPWRGGQHAHPHAAPLQQQQPLQQRTQFTLGVIHTQPHGVRDQQDRRGASHNEQNHLQGLQSVNPSQPQLLSQTWPAQLPPAVSYCGPQHPRYTMTGNSSDGGVIAGGVLVSPWGQQLQSSSVSPTIISSGQIVSSIDNSSSFNGSPDTGGQYSHRGVFAGQRARGTPPSSPRIDGVSPTHGKKRKPRGTTGTTMPAPKRTPPHPAEDGGGARKRVEAVAATSSAGARSQAANVGGGGGGKGVPPCEPCEKEFVSELARQAHLAAHVVCQESGCYFSALRKVVNYHHEIKHGQFSGSGFQIIDVEGEKFRVLLGTNPGEVEEWRASRRKLWPTTANVARKADEAKKRRQLGDLGPDPGQGGKGRGRGRGRGRDRGRGRGGLGRVGRQSVSDRASLDDVDKKSEANENAAGTAMRDCGELEGGLYVNGKSMGGEVGSSGEGAGDDGVSEAGTKVGAGAEAGQETTRDRPKRLCSFYLKDRCRKGDACTFSHDVERKHCSYFLSGKCHRGKSCTFIHDFEARTRAKLETRDDPDSASGSAEMEKPGAKRVKAERAALYRVQSKPTLLRKLLAPQLHRESSIALQAVRFIVRSNFFLDPSPAESDSEPSHPTPTDSTTMDAAAASTDGLPSGEKQRGEGVGKNQDCVEEVGYHKHLIEAGYCQSSASAKAPGGAAAAVAVANVAINGCDNIAAAAAPPPPSTAATESNGRALEEFESAGSSESCVEEVDPKRTPEVESFQSSTSAKAPGVAAGAVAEDTIGGSDTAAALKATSTSTTGLPLGESQSSEAEGVSQNCVKEKDYNLHPTSKKEPTSSAVGLEIAAVAGFDDVTDASDAFFVGAVVVAAAAAATSTSGILTNNGQASGSSRNRVEVDDPHQPLETEYAQRLAATAGVVDIATDTSKVVDSAASSTNGLPPKEDRQGEAVKNQSRVEKGDDLRQGVVTRSAQSAASIVVPGVAPAAAGGVVTTNIKALQGEDQGVETASMSRSRVEEEDPNLKVEKESAEFPATTGV